MLHKLFRRGMSCEDVLEVLQSYLDGETDDATARQVLDHLHGCGHCDRESDVYLRIKVSLRKRATAVDPEIRSALSRFSERVARGEIR
ncbi:MAG: zf-HC2 domain-containing protein [Acidimicrobiia bacterium]|nr:zf-HC2 domain-containing protein [Acidimicrobiia bacterium]